MRERTAYLVCTGLLTALTLVPLWGTAFPPMQDYPQHLFVAHVFATFDDPAFDWGAVYQRSFPIGPYSLAYYAMAALAQVFPIEVAGKLFVSVYLGLFGLFAALEGRGREAEEPVPWALLLLFPLAFHQAYYLGLLNYLIALPLLLLALRSLARFASEPVTLGGSAAQAMFVVLLYLAHPYASAIYGVLGLATAALAWRSPERARRAAAPPMVLVLVLAASVAYALATAERNGGAGLGLSWWPLRQTLAYFALMFTEMRFTAGLSVVAFLTWCGVAGVFALAAWRGPRPRVPAERLVFLIACVAGLLVLPFSVASGMGPATYLNVRLAPLCYAFATVVLSHLALSRGARVLVVVLAVALLWSPWRLHRGVSAEIAELVPVLERMEPGARVLPVYRSATSAWLDSFLFYQLHSHTADYYHLRVGGGASPNLFALPQPPIQYRRDVAPLPRLEPGTSAETLRAAYRYVLVRAAADDPPQNERGVVVRNGAWTLRDTRLLGPGPRSGLD